MTIKKLVEYFKSNNVPEHYYVIGGLGSGEVDGIAYENDSWVTYYSERGKKRDVEIHKSEEAACIKLAKLVQERMEDEDGLEMPDFLIWLNVNDKPKS